MFYTQDKIKEANEFYEQHHLDNVSQLKELKIKTDNLEKLALFVINTAFVKMQLNKGHSFLCNSNLKACDEDESGLAT